MKSIFKNKKLFIICIFFIFFSCLNKSEITNSQKKIEAQTLKKSIEVLAKKLNDSADMEKVGRVGVLNFYTSTNERTYLGEYISDKLNEEIYKNNFFSCVLERKDLKKIEKEYVKEFDILFNEKTVEDFGQILGTNSFVIGKIHDLGKYLDISAKIIRSSTGEVVGQASIQLLKNEEISLLQQKKMEMSATTISPSTGEVMGTNIKFLKNEENAHVKKNEIKATLKNYIDLSNINNFLDKEVSLCLNICQVYSDKKGNIYLNIGGYYPDNFLSLIIYKNNLSNFKINNFENLKNKTIEVTGIVKKGKEKYIIILNNNDQINLNVGDKKVSKLCYLYKNIDKKINLEAQISSIRYTNSGNIYLNIGGEYPYQILSLIIFKDKVKNFKNIDIYKNKKILISGFVTKYKSKYQIKITNPNYISIL